MNSAIPEKSKEKLQPWNSGDYPVQVNSIRYNQDLTLFSLGTSKGYKIFSCDTLKPVNDDSQAIRNLGPLQIVMVYFKSSLVFFLPSKNNQNLSSKEIIIYDDAVQKKISGFKIKTEEILDFSVSRNEIFIITLSKIITLELLTFKVIRIVDNINSTSGLISYNFFDFIAFIKLKSKIKVYVNYYNNKNHRAIMVFKRLIKSSFDFIQCIQISPSGNMVALISILGNKIHIYYTNNARLKECIYIGGNGNIIDRVLFSFKNENYILLIKNIIDNENYDNNKKQFLIYKLQKHFIENPNCVCHKYKDDGKDDNSEQYFGFFGFFIKKSKNNDIKEEHATDIIRGNLHFIDFDKNVNKGLIIINKEGYYYKYLFSKSQEGNILPKVCLKWA